MIKLNLEIKRNKLLLGLLGLIDICYYFQSNYCQNKAYRVIHTYFYYIQINFNKEKIISASYIEMLYFLQLLLITAYF